MDLEKLKKTIEDTINESAAFSAVAVTDVVINFPPYLDDTEHIFKISWSAKLEDVKDEPNVTEIVKGNMIGGYMGWPTVEVPEEEIVTAVRRQASWIILTEIVPERDFIYQALRASKFSANSVLMGMFMHDTIQVMSESMHKARKPDQIYTPSKACRIISDALSRQATPHLQDVRNRMAKDMMGQTDTIDIVATLPEKENPVQ